MAVTQSAPGRRSAPRKSPVRRAFQLVGTLLIVAGLVVIGYFAWQYFGTNIVAKQRQADIKQSLAEAWGKDIEGDAIGLLRVDRFGEDYEVPIVPGGDLVEKKGVDALSRGVAWYEKGAKPGEIGNFVVAGHRVTHGEPFAKFPDLRKGDEVEVETRTHVYTYELLDGGQDIRVDFKVSWPLAPIPTPDAEARKKDPTERLMTLVTCSEIFHTRDRNVVVAKLVDTADKSKPRPAE